MGTEVASRPPLPPGLTLGSGPQGPGKKKVERRPSSRPGSSSSSSNRPIYSRDYHLRIQGHKYSLSSAFVCIGAKIHRRYNTPPTLGGKDDRFRDDENPHQRFTPPIFDGGGRRVYSPLDVSYKKSKDTTNTCHDRKYFCQSTAASSSKTSHGRYLSPPVFTGGSSDISPDDLLHLPESHLVPTQSLTQYPQILIDRSCLTPTNPGATLAGKSDAAQWHTSGSELTEENLFRHTQFHNGPSIGDSQVDTFRYVHEASLRTFPYQTRRGLSRLTQDHPADIEIVEEKQTSLPPEFSNKLVEAIRGSYQHTPPSSNRSSPTITEEIPSSSPSIVQGDIWGGGNTTERSSVDSQYSWDEFDRQAAKTVQNLFDEIDSVLFERRPNQAEYIYNECQEWGAQFPHLRILGRQLLPVQESGFQMIERDMSRPNTMSSMGLLDITDQDFSGSSQDSQGLSLSGRRLKAILPPVEARSRNSGTPSSHSTEFSHLEEEVFESEGEYEEIIAVDYKDIFEDLSDGKKVITPRRRQPGYPPITPNACLKDGVASSAFDCMWQEVISWIRPLLRKYSNIVLGNKNFIQSLQNISLPPRNESTPGLQSRENSNIRGYGLLRSHTVIDRPTDSKNLEEVLQIKRKIPIQREPSQILSDMPETNMPQARPASSNLPITLKRPNSTRYNRNIPPKGKLLLAPIPGYDRSVVKTPSVDEVPHPASMALLGKKLSVHPERRLSPPPHVIRNGALPPIGTPVELDTNPRFQPKKTSSRASSAVDKDLRAFKERLFNSQDARPSTTHAFRSETPQGRRASTPSSSAFNNLSMSRNNSFGIGGMGLDVRGNSLQPTHDQLGNIPQEILEDHESLDEHIHPNQWTPSTPSHGNPYYRAGRSRQISSLVRS